VLKSSTLPLCSPAPRLSFVGVTYCFTGTFVFGQRKACEKAVVDRGGSAGGLSRKTDVLVVGAYATESWKHSAFAILPTMRKVQLFELARSLFQGGPAPFRLGGSIPAFALTEYLLHWVQHPSLASEALCRHEPGEEESHVGGLAGEAEPALQDLTHHRKP
jgi:hypothetical protein